MPILFNVESQNHPKHACRTHPSRFCRLVVDDSTKVSKIGARLTKSKFLLKFTTPTTPHATKPFGVQMKNTKISIKVLRPLFDKLSSKCDEVCIRRDAYLNHLFSNEINKLESEVAEPNSLKAQQMLSRSFKELDTVQVGINLSVEVANRIAHVCAAKRVPRECWMNRIFLLLVAKPETIDTLFFSGYEGNWRKEIWEHFENAPETQREAFERFSNHLDPFAWLREGIFFLVNEGKTSEESSEGFYKTIFPPLLGQVPLAGLNCRVREEITLDDIDLDSIDTPKASDPDELDRMLGAKS